MEVIQLGWFQHTSTGQPQHVVLGCAAGKFPGDFFVVEHQHPIGESEQFRQIGRDHDDRQTLARQLVDDVVEFAFGADVDALGGLVEHDDLGLGEQPAGQQHLLLVATGQG